MATPTPTAHLPTRQQLDEIDALLKRMLSLPSIGGESVSEPASAEPTPAAPPVEMTFPAPVIHEVPPARPPAPDEPVVQSWRVQWPQAAARAPSPQPPSVVAWGSPVPLATLAEEPDSPGRYAPPQGHPSPPPAPAAPYPVAEAVPDDPIPAGPPVSPALWPFVALNVAFHFLTHLLGPFGAWLRGPGRTLLGWLGVGMILAAGVWAAGAWLGYDWPKPDLSQLGLSPP